MDLLITSLYSDNFSYKQLKIYNSLKRFLGLIYLIEFLLKIFSIGSKGYLSIYTNKIHFVIIFGLIAGEVKKIFVNDNNSIIARVFKIFDLLFLIRIISENQRLFSLARLILFLFSETYIYLILFCFFVFIYSIIGCNLFFEVKKGVYVSEFINFHNFIYGMGTLFKAVSGDDWQYLMFDFSNINNGSSF